MRILIIRETATPVASRLARLGHQVAVIRPSLRRVLLECGRLRPNVAYVRLSALRTPLLLTALRVPYVLEIDRQIERDSKAILIARGARTAVAPSEELARFAVDALGARDASIVPDGIDLPSLVPGDREEAKRRLGLQPNLRIVTMIGRLDPELRLDLLAEAHRRLSGTALLVAGDGPQAPFVQAMRAATRPSSPIIFLGARPRNEELLAIQAAEACVSVGPIGTPNLEYAACGKRQVALAGEGSDRIESLYPSDPAAVILVEPSAPALRAALERALEAGELSFASVESARSLLDWSHSASQLAQVLEDAIET